MLDGPTILLFLSRPALEKSGASLDHGLRFFLVQVLGGGLDQAALPGNVQVVVGLL